jgi:hypothetical protein
MTGLARGMIRLVADLPAGFLDCDHVPAIALPGPQKNVPLLPQDSPPGDGPTGPECPAANSTPEEDCRRIRLAVR